MLRNYRKNKYILIKLFGFRKARFFFYIEVYVGVKMDNWIYLQGRPSRREGKCRPKVKRRRETQVTKPNREYSITGCRAARERGLKTASFRPEGDLRVKQLAIYQIAWSDFKYRSPADIFLRPLRALTLPDFDLLFLAVISPLQIDGLLTPIDRQRHHDHH